MSDLALPGDWEAVPLRKIADVIDPHPSHRAPPEELEGVPFAGIGDLNSRGEIVSSSVRRVHSSVLKEHALRYRIDEHSIGFGRVASIGKIVDFRRKEEGIAISPTMAVVQPRTISKPYLLAALRGTYVAAQVQRLLTGSTRSSLGIALLRELRIPVPNNRMRCEEIGDLFSLVEETMEQTEALIVKMQKIKSGLMHDLFTRGVTADGQLRPPHDKAPQLYKKSPLGLIPKEWDYDYLSELTTRIVDGVHHTPTYVEHGVPFVTVKNLTSSRTISFGDLNYISLRDHQDFSRRADPKFGDVLVTKDGTLGVSRLVEERHPEFSIFVSVAMLRPIAARLRPRMLHMFFDCGAYERQLGHLSAGTGLKHIHLEHFRRFVVPLPNGDEQERIAGVADSIEGKLKKEEAQLAKLQRLRKALMHDLLGGVVSTTVDCEPELKGGAAGV